MKIGVLLSINVLLYSTLTIAQPAPFDTLTLLYAGEERHLSNLRQLTFGGDNAEAYFSPDGKAITFQATNKQWGDSCDQIYMFRFADGDMRKGPPTRISTGLGRTTCSYFLDNEEILYASTHE